MANVPDMEKLKEEFLNWKEKDLDPAISKFGERVKRFD